ncbi:hypothetical protein G4D82_10470 [Flavobacterium sp. CYK-4]|uniref:hypothetical protein n=1 Tax=Flavobacterium lotistagni TaxID=2709660 RepID=UPI00140B5F57|nr:hypothetical protein [Flavobacterium lotistagni]NHM07647.1 hypothetical protein [Flavobacterium lotistagni]
MKLHIPIFIFLLVSKAAFAQTLRYDKITNEGKFTEYFSKSGESIKINDTIEIGYPGNGSRFNFITQGNEPAGVIIANTKVVVTKIKSIGNPKRGYKAYLFFSGYGLLPVVIDYESALETHEVKRKIN